MEGQTTTTKITREVLEAHLDCKYKGHLKSTGEQGTRPDYEALLRTVAGRASLLRCVMAVQYGVARTPTTGEGLDNEWPPL